MPHDATSPPDDSQRIASDVMMRLTFDRDGLRSRVSARFRPDPARNDLIECERLAGEVVADAWGEIALDCEQALEAVHELYLEQVSQVIEAQQDLQANGAGSWIARAVLYEQAFQLAWDVLDEKGLLMELP
jgi:hypothetical protein